MPSTFEWAVAVLLPLISTVVAHGLFSADSAASHFKQWCLYMLLDSAFGNLFHLTLLVPARWIASRLPGSKVPSTSDEKQWSEQEEQTNNPSIIWPSPATIAMLPADWIAPGCRNKNSTSDTTDNAIAPKASHSSNKKRRSTKSKAKPAPDMPNKAHATQPYYLNHVRGSTSIRRASQRVGAALGTLSASFLICSYSSTVSLDDIGLGIESATRVVSDLASGFAVGATIIVILFLLELRMGWIKVVGYFETVDPKEVFAINFGWDVLFHVGVSINEEVMLRGWMFILGCRGTLQYAMEWNDQPRIVAAFAIATSIVLQSTLFALMHVHSPGSTAVSLVNLFIGGVAAALNLMVSGGGLWLGIGWHFGWNIMMGHILGRTTSGIPMSCAAVSVVPRPALPGKASYVKYHGGTFGPEMGVLAPLAYALGIIMVVCLYGWKDLVAWVDRLAADVLRHCTKDRDNVGDGHLCRSRAFRMTPPNLWE